RRHGSPWPPHRRPCRRPRSGSRTRVPCFAPVSGLSPIMPRSRPCGAMAWKNRLHAALIGPAATLAAMSSRPSETDPAVRALARAAGLVYVSDAQPGIRRWRRGKGFGYRDADGRPVADPAELARIRALAIPPAYEQVWI